MTNDEFRLIGVGDTLTIEGHRGGFVVRDVQHSGASEDTVFCSRDGELDNLTNWTRLNQQNAKVVTLKAKLQPAHEMPDGEQLHNNG